MDAYMNIINELAFMDEKLDSLLESINSTQKKLNVLEKQAKFFIRKYERSENEKLINKLLSPDCTLNLLSDIDLAKLDAEFEKAINICYDDSKYDKLIFLHQFVINEIRDRNL